MISRIFDCVGLVSTYSNVHHLHLFYYHLTLFSPSSSLLLTGSFSGLYWNNFPKINGHARYIRRSQHHHRGYSIHLDLKVLGGARYIIIFSLFFNYYLLINVAPSSSSTNVPPKELVEDEIVIGRNSSCGVRLDDRRISSRHAKIYREPENTGFYKIFIVDLR